MNDASIIPVTAKGDLLKPLLSDEKEKKKEYRKRNKSYEDRSVHPADVQKFIDKGWELQREGKSSSRIKRAKSHNVRLEDRVWCLLFKMGYPTINGANFKIKFEREDGSSGTKQIDVYAGDAETVFIIECKSKEFRDRRSLQKDIQETISLQNHIRASINESYKGKSRPKIIWAYATNNIIWSESDFNRAAAGKITIITENELQYFEAFIKHMGPAGKYQILGEFLKGQKIEGLGTVKIPAIKGRIGGEEFFSFVSTPRNLIKIAFINHQALNHPDGKPAYQRMLSSSRIKKIEQFITHGGYFPTNILVNFTNKPKWEPISNKENTDPNIKFGWITLPSVYRSAWIIDGQHRLYGYSSLDDKYLDQSLFVLAFNGMDTRKEADLFITINHEQKSVPKSLLTSLMADLKLGDSNPKTALTALASAVVRALNSDKTSPFFRRFAQHGVAPEAMQSLTITEAVNGLNASELLGRVAHGSIVKGPISEATDSKSIERSRIILNGYFDALRNAAIARWEAGKQHYLCYNPGIRAHFMLIAEIVRYLNYTKGLDFITMTPNRFVEEITEIAQPVFNFAGRASDKDLKDAFAVKFGSGGPKEYLYKLFELIHAVYPDFGPKDFLDWTSRTESQRIEEAYTFVMRLSEKIIDTVVSTLKRVHGEKRLDSGNEAFWEIGVKHRRIRENAYKKQQDDSQERRKKLWAYLDIIDIPEIIQQKNNWVHFEGIFNLPMSGEKGKKYYLEWIFRFNDLRKIAAHPSKMRTFNDEDLDFLDWLRTDLDPKLEKELNGG